MSIRMDPGKKNRVIYPADAVFEIGKGYTAKEGTDISIIACGEMVDYGTSGGRIMRKKQVFL